MIFVESVLAAFSRTFEQPKIDGEDHHAIFGMPVIF
jgi:hypothetical protein